MTQKELADKAGISEISIRKYEAGTRNPKSEQIIKIADALGLSIVIFEEETDLQVKLDTVGDVMSLLLLLEEKIGVDFFFKYETDKPTGFLSIDPSTVTIQFRNKKVQEGIASWILTKSIHEHNQLVYKYRKKDSQEETSISDLAIENSSFDLDRYLMMVDRKSLEDDITE